MGGNNDLEGASASPTASPVLRTEPQEGLGPDGRVPTGARFTPGPWRFSGWPIEAYTDGEPGIVIRETVAFMDRSNDERRDANARLIAAAPDLFEACDAALTFIANTRGKLAGLYRDKLRAALAAASVDTRPKDGGALAAPLASGAVTAEGGQTPSPTTPDPGQQP